jgi:hypothetical protein
MHRGPSYDLLRMAHENWLNLLRNRLHCEYAGFRRLQHSELLSPSVLIQPGNGAATTK